MRHPNLIKWEKQLKRVFDKVDEYLEYRYGSVYPLHPARAEKGTTSNKEHDGLFNIGASFSAGYGSRFGRGYVIEVDMVTLAAVDPHIQVLIEQDAVEKVKEELAIEFPDKKLMVERDGRVFKIFGDLSL